MSRENAAPRKALAGSRVKIGLRLALARREVYTTPRGARRSRGADPVAHAKVTPIDPVASAKVTLSPTPPYLFF